MIRKKRIVTFFVTAIIIFSLAFLTIRLIKNEQEIRRSRAAGGLATFFFVPNQVVTSPGESFILALYLDPTPGQYRATALEASIVYPADKLILNSVASGDFFQKHLKGDPGVISLSKTEANNPGVVKLSLGALCTTAAPWRCFPAPTTGETVTLKFTAMASASGGAEVFVNPKDVAVSALNANDEVIPSNVVNLEKIPLVNVLIRPKVTPAPTPTTAPCLRSNPTARISPPSQVGAGGKTLQYGIKVTNNDSADCQPSRFSVIGYQLPGKWEQIPYSFWTDYIKPGSSATVSFELTPPTGTADGNYQFTEKVGSVDNYNYSTFASATYVVNNPTPTPSPIACTRKAPTMSFAVPNQTGRAGQTLIYPLIVNNNDSPGCPETTFEVSNWSAPTNWQLSPGNSSTTLKGGSGYSTTINVSSATNAAPGQYGFTEKVVRKGSQEEIYANANYQVSAPTPVGCVVSCVSATTTGTCKQGSPCKTSDQKSDALPKVTFTVNSSGCSDGVTVDLSLGQFSATAPVDQVPWGTWWSAVQINQPGVSSADWNFCSSTVCHTFDPGQTLYWRVRDSATGQSKAICPPFNGPLSGTALLQQSTLGFFPTLSRVLGASTVGGDIWLPLLRLLVGL